MDLLSTPFAIVIIFAILYLYTVVAIQRTIIALAQIRARVPLSCPASGCPASGGTEQMGEAEYPPTFQQQ